MAVSGRKLQRVSTAVPWPRGVTFHRAKLFALARGCPRGAGGPHKFVFDDAGSIFSVRPDKWEWVSDDQEVSPPVRKNGRKFAEPDPAVFKLWSRAAKQPYNDIETDRPYATLAWDDRTRNFFICGFSGIDNAPNDRHFRKNGTDGILRYDTRSKSWHVVERHDATLIPIDRRRKPTTVDFPATLYKPKARPPRGWLNGPDGLLVIGQYLYAVGKDNHVLVRYDLTDIGAQPDAKAPRSELVLRGKKMGGVDGTDGPSALARLAEHLYVGFRSTGRIVRFQLEGDGLAKPAKGELVADFGGSKQLIDLAGRGGEELFVSLKQGEIWQIPVKRDSVFQPGGRSPYFVIEGASLSNIAVDNDGRLYVCTNNHDDRSSRTGGTIYRIVEEGSSAS